MKKFVALFTDSYRELKSVRTITTMAMLAAIAIILGMFSIEYGNFIRIGFSSIPNGIIAYLFGPTVGGIFSGTLDIIKYILKPTGPFCPQLTLVTMLAGVMYGCMYYKKKLTLPRVLITKFIVMLVCNVFLNTIAMVIMGYFAPEVFWVKITTRIVKNLTMLPIEVFILLLVLYPVMVAYRAAFREKRSA